MKLVNLTPHALNIHHRDGAVYTLAPSGDIARVGTEFKPQELPVTVDGFDIPLFRVATGKVEGLPAPQSGVVYVVSGMVEAAAKDRADVWSPGFLVRNAEGRPVGCKGLKKSC